MPMTAGQRTVLLRRLYLFTPFVAAVGAAGVALSGLDRWAMEHVPARFATYAQDALQAAPLGWFFLVAGCAFGTCFDLAQQDDLKGWRLALYLVCVTPFVVLAQVAFCGAVSTVCNAVAIAVRGY